MCWQAAPDGLVLSVRLTPKAAVDGVGRLSDGAEVVPARVWALPAMGTVNAALVALLARVLKTPKRTIEIVLGAGGPLQWLHIA